MKSLSMTNDCLLAGEHGTYWPPGSYDHIYMMFYFLCSDSSEILKFVECLDAFMFLISRNLLDCPAPLVSSDRSVSMPVEASIEDLHDTQYEPSEDYIQADARLPNGHSLLEEKLDRELQYHKHGDYNREIHPEAAILHHTLNPFLSMRQPAQDRSSVQIWEQKEPVQPINQEETPYWPSSGLSSYIPSHLPVSVSSPSLSQFNQQQPHSQMNRQTSCPAYPVSDTFGPDKNTGGLFTSKCGSLQDGGTLKRLKANSLNMIAVNCLSFD